MEKTPYQEDVVSISTMDGVMASQFERESSAQIQPSKPFNMQHMIALTEELASVLEEESGLLKQGRVADVAPFKEHKERLAAMLDVEKERLHQNPSIVQQMDETAKALLERAITHFTDAAMENKRLIEAARAVNQRVFSMIGKAAQRIHKHTPYTALGRTAAAPKHAVAMKINERI